MEETDKSKGPRTRTQGAINPLLNVQRSNLDSFYRMCSSVNKLPTSPSPTTIERKLQSMGTFFENCRKIHNDLIIQTDDEVAHYIGADEFGNAESRYLEVIDFLTTLQDKSAAIPSTSFSTNTSAFQPTPQRCNLEKIALPMFDGDYKDWTQFKDLFEALVLRETTLTNVQKLYYLKTSLSGSALALIKNIAVTEANFTTAWRIISDHYQDIQIMTFSLIYRMLKLKPVSGESASALESLIAQTREIVMSLENIGQFTADSILVVMTLLRVDPQIRKHWEESIGKRDNFPAYNELELFLKNKVHALTVAQAKSGITLSSDVPFSKGNKSRNVESKLTTHVSTASLTCYLCSQAHSVASCSRFKSLDATGRLDFVKSQRLCFNCLNKGHIPSTCKRRRSCPNCKRRHNPLLHEALAQPQLDARNNLIDKTAPECSSVMTPKLNPNAATFSTAHSGCLNSQLNRAALIATAWVRVRTTAGNELCLRAIIDSGSECSLLSERGSQLLRVPRSECSASISGIGATVSGVVRHAARLQVLPQDYTGDPIFVEVLILPKLSSYAPRRYVKSSHWPHLEKLQLADPDPCSNHPIDLILGVDCYDKLVHADRLKFPGGPSAIRSVFGWLLRGPIEDAATSHHIPVTALHVTFNNDLIRAVERFWEVEEIPHQTHLTEEEDYCERLFVETTTRDPDGRFTVALPFKSPPPLNLGNSLKVAQAMFIRMERRLDRDPGLKAEYSNFLNEYEQLGHMCPYAPSSQSEEVYYIPHHPVIKPSSSSTKVRVVFNASARTDIGKSLNASLLVGPKLQQDLPAIILRWRQHKFVCSADITKMFRQIRIREEDTKFQLVLHRSPSTNEVTSYRLLTVTYGTASAPYLAQRTLIQLADDEKANYPLASAIVIENTFMDDTFFGCSSIDGCRELRNQLISLFSRGAFSLHKWTSNVPELLTDLPSNLIENSQSMALQEDFYVKVLGIYWDPARDVFAFRVDPEVPQCLNKRTFLSFLAKCYDPLGWLAPVIVAGKILMQQLWTLSIAWDNKLPDPIFHDCLSFCEDLQKLAQVHLPRWLQTCPVTGSVELHGFADASKRAYAGVIYLRVVREGTIETFLLTSKTKVAPLKVLSIPRLELNAAELLSRLLKWVASALHLNCDVPMYAWSDSTVALAWIRRPPSNWKTFVANRVSAIQSRCPTVQWRHVPSEDNPADLASRGLRSSDLINNTLWWHGPPWLVSGDWPSLEQSGDEELIELENCKKSVHVTCRQDWELASRFSDWGKLIRVTSLVLRFISRLRRQDGREISPLTWKNHAKNLWIKYMQSQTFEKELELLKKGDKLPRSSVLATMNPYLDKEGIIRMQGRLQHSPLNFKQKFPIILANCPLVILLVRHAHLRSLHGNNALTARILREESWIIRSKIIIRSVINNCVICTRYRANLGQQQMAPLPSIRFRCERPFFSVGIDYAGPLLARALPGRGHQSRKMYIAVFVCMTTRAIHIELVHDLTTNAFLDAFRRFISRRGVPAQLLSDNGTNFQGGQAELAKKFRSALRNPAVEAKMLEYEIEWRFIPPSSPHFGGMWEAGVKSIKYHLRRIVGTHTLTISELETLLCQIEACVNSRPIAGFSSDCDDLSYLTPGHFLIGAPLLSLPEPYIPSPISTSLKRYHLVQRMRDRFWKVWQLDYINTLQKRSKWRLAHPNFRVGDLVLIKNDSLPPSRWALGRITKCIPGKDGLVRVCEIKSASSSFLRPIHKLCPLPVNAVGDGPTAGGTISITDIKR